MNFVDVAIILLLLLFGFRGWRRGLFRSLIGLVGFVIAAFLAIAYLNRGADLILRSFAIPPQVAAVISFLGLFLIALVAFHIIGLIFHKLIHLTPVGLIDTLGGAALGLLKGGLILSLILLLLSMLPLPQGLQQQINTSFLAGPTRSIAPYLFNKLKEEFPKAKDKLEENLPRKRPEVFRGKPDSSSTPLSLTKEYKALQETFGPFLSTEEGKAKLDSLKKNLEKRIDD